jgi:hypothetical protein
MEDHKNRTKVCKLIKRSSSQPLAIRSKVIYEENIFNDC